MDLQKKIQLLEKQCQMTQMLLCHISSLLEVAPHEMLQRQLQDVENAMFPMPLQPEDTVAAYFPKTTTTGYVYVLRLKGDELHDHYYYVGYTQDVAKRMIDHFSGNGAEWTKLHPPHSVVEVSEGDKCDERQRTIATMKTYGWSTTRGYCWTSKMLKSPPRELDM